MNSVGHCYYNGYSVPVDYTEAFRWFKKSADAGNKKAQYNLGVCYELGKGVKKDISEAKKWYRKAADNGHEKARERLLNL